MRQNAVFRPALASAERQFGDNRRVEIVRTIKRLQRARQAHKLRDLDRRQAVAQFIAANSDGFGEGICGVKMNAVAEAALQFRLQRVVLVSSDGRQQGGLNRPAEFGEEGLSVPARTEYLSGVQIEGLRNLQLARPDVGGLRDESAPELFLQAQIP